MKELDTLMEEASKEANRIKDEVFLETLKTFRERCKYYLEIEKEGD